MGSQNLQTANSATRINDMTYQFQPNRVVHLPATTTTPQVEIHAAKVLFTMQRAQDTMFIPLREIRGNRVRSTWATRDAVLAALHNLIHQGLVEQGEEVGRDGIARPRYRLTHAGEMTQIHTSRLAKIRKRSSPTFDVALAAAQAVCPPGYLLCLVPAHAMSVANPATIPTPTPTMDEMPF